MIHASIKGLTLGSVRAHAKWVVISWLIGPPMGWRDRICMYAAGIYGAEQTLRRQRRKHRC